MNRLRRWPEKDDESSRPTPGTENSAGFLEQHESAPCTFFAPSRYTPEYAYPLLVWLHGPGDDENQLRRIMPYLSTQNYVAVGPRGCCDPDPGCLGYQWRQHKEAILAAEQRVLASMEAACCRYHVDLKRIFIGGYQSGGTAALRLALSFPERFAGAISIGGPFPQNLSPLSRLREIRQLPFFLAQGRDSLLYPLHLACEEYRLFHIAGLRMAIHQYPCGDEMTTQMLYDMHQWMMERITGASMNDENTMQVVSGDAG